MENRREINPEQFFGIVRKRLVWIIAIGILAAILVGILSVFLITPKYSSTAKLYVNAKHATQENSITQAELTVAKSLVDTYIVIIQSDTTLEQVAQMAGVKYTPKEIRKNLKAISLNDTEAFSVTVTDPDPEIALNIANAIVVVAPQEIVRVIEAGSVKIIDNPKLATEANDTGLSRNVIIGFFAGALISFVAFFLAEILDVTIYDEEDLEGQFNYPIIGIIPSITGIDGSEKSKLKVKSKKGDK